MKTRNEYIKILRDESDKIRDGFGVNSLCIFGSVARNDQHQGSDIDICVDMPPKMLTMIRLKDYLETILQTSVDLVRQHPNMNAFLQKEIKRDSVYVF